MAGCLCLMQVPVLGDTVADAVPTELGQGAARGRHYLRLEVQVRFGIVLQHILKADLQLSPLTGYVTQLIALLPPLQAVTGDIFLCVAMNLQTRRIRPSTQGISQCLQHAGYMVVELTPGQRRGDVQTGNALGCNPPLCEDGLALRIQVRGQRMQLDTCKFGWGRSQDRWFRLLGEKRVQHVLQG